MLLGLVAFAATAQPNITYLECDALQRGQRVHYSITLNENEGSADWTGPTVSRRDAARFTADAVYFQAFKISRSNLSLLREYPNVMGDGIETETGQCQIAKPVKRAF